MNIVRISVSTCGLEAGTVHGRTPGLDALPTLRLCMDVLSVSHLHRGSDGPIATTSLVSERWPFTSMAVPCIYDARVV
jgi:hypothetical protein